LELGGGSGDQRSALVGAPAGELAIAAGDEALAGEVGVLELEQVALVEQVHLQRAALEQGADLAALERGDPAEVLTTQLLDRGLADHAAVADHHDVAQAEL